MKIYKRRKLPGLSRHQRTWIQLGDPECRTLSEMLESVVRHNEVYPAAARIDQIAACGSLEQMTREWMMEPLAHGWRFGREFVFKHRTATYFKKGELDDIAVKLISHRESWLPGCENADTAANAWRVLESEWKSTGLPLLSSPAATGRALLWETLPRGVEFPSLDDDLARLIRANSPQHRIETFKAVIGDMETGEILNAIQYDGRWMYASLCGLDRFPVGEPRRAEGFTEYAPGVYDVTIRIPNGWDRIGLIPTRDAEFGWLYPHAQGYKFRTWAFEPELTLAIHKVKDYELPAWEIMEVHDGYVFDKGRPLAGWSAKLIEMRDRLQKASKALFEKLEDATGLCLAADNHLDHAAAAVRQILNHTIGSVHKNEFEREEFVSDDNFRQWRREHPDLAESERYGAEKVEGGWLVPSFVPDTSRLSIFMPHWSATLYSLARARVAEWALRCDPATLVKIHGDAIYSTCEQPELDKLDTERLGQPRRK